MTAPVDVSRYNVDAGEGLVLNVEVSGAGPTLLLLHGFTGSATTWMPFRASLGEHHTVVAIDLPGHGRSTSPVDPGRYLLERFADDIVAVLDSLSLSDVALLGYSMGGRAALHFAVAFGDRLSGLVLESTSPGIGDRAGREGRQVADAALANFIEAEGMPAFVDQWERLPLWGNQAALSEEVRANLRQQRLANDPTGLANSLRGAGTGTQPPMHDLLNTITCPTLVVTGALDEAYVNHGRLLQSSIPDSKLEIIENAGHAVHLEQPAAFASAVQDFLA